MGVFAPQCVPDCDGSPWSTPFAADLVTGFRRRPKQIPPKYFYDEIGSRLFEEITELPEYYPTRTEIAILKQWATDIAGFMQPGAALIEFGSGSSTKIKLLLDEIDDLYAYVPVDISGDFLNGAAAALMQDRPSLRILPVAADFTAPFALPDELAGRPHVGFFPGSTIGNFEPAEALAFLRHAAAVLGQNSTLIVGVDLVKDPRILNAAYNDAAGVTAAFNLNVLARANRELCAGFDLSAFDHRAFYNAPLGRIEMHLLSRRAQTVWIGGEQLRLDLDESIHTESSYKYTVEGFTSLSVAAGWRPGRVWTDAERLFSVHALVHP